MKPSEALHYVSCLLWYDGPQITVERFDDGTPCLVFEDYNSHRAGGQLAIPKTVIPTTEEILDAMCAGFISEREVIFGSSETIWQVREVHEGGKIAGWFDWTPMKPTDLDWDIPSDTFLTIEGDWRRP